MFNKIKSTIRRWMHLLFNKSKTIKDITNTQISDEHYKFIDKWKSIYRGYLDDWHNVSYTTVEGTKKRRMYTLNMGKVAAEELAKLIFTEQVKINISDEQFDQDIQNMLSQNRFKKTFQGKLEQMFAMGGLILKAHPKELTYGSYKMIINYVTTDCFIPTSWENDEVTEGVFLNISKQGNKSYCLFEFHKWENRQIEHASGEKEYKKVYVIKNELYEGDEKTEGNVKKVPLETLYEGLEKEVVIEYLTRPLFQYIRPNIANNIDLQNPLGISIFANAMDTLYAIDVAFDSFIREFRLGKRRIIVPASSLKTITDPNTGNIQRYFDSSDETYQAFNFQDPEKQKIQDNTVELRVEEHISAINSLLNLYSMQIGFSSGTFTFDGQSVKTATEIVSEKSKTYQTKQSNENLIEEGLVKFIHTLGEVGALYDIIEPPKEDTEVTMYWDDSIIQDRKTDSDFYIKLKNANLVTGKYALMQILDFTEEEADDMMLKVKGENATQNPGMDNILGEFE